MTLSLRFIGAFCLTLLASDAACVRAQDAAPAPPVAIFQSPKQAFDALLEMQPIASLPPDNETGVYAWTESAILTALLRMYEGTGDRIYLDTFIQRAKHVLSVRDSVRGVKDYRGLSLPVWSAGGPYTIGDLTLKDNNGQGALRIKLAGGGSFNLTKVTAQTAPNGSFSLRLENPRLSLDEKWDDLSLDPASPNYFAARLKLVPMAQPTARVRLRVEDIAPQSARRGRSLAPFEGSMTTPRVVWAVHQGMIVGPLSTFARIVKRSPLLSAEPALSALADEFIVAAEASLQTLQPDWNETPQGEGFYVFAKGTPVNFDGSEAPLNQYLTVGRAMIELVAAGREKWRPQAEKMARRLKSNLAFNSTTGGYSWPYWPKTSAVYRGYEAKELLSENTPQFGGRASSEDTSHAAIEVGFILAAAREGIVFEHQDLVRLANTFVNQIVKTAPDGKTTLSNSVDGLSTVEAKPVPEWLLLGAVEPRIPRVFEALLAEMPLSRSVMLLQAAANIQTLRGY